MFKPSFGYSESALAILSYIKEKRDERQKWSHSFWENVIVHTSSSPVSSLSHSLDPLFLAGRGSVSSSKDAGVIIHPFVVSQNHLFCYQNRQLFKFPSSESLSFFFFTFHRNSQFVEAVQLHWSFLIETHECTFGERSLSLKTGDREFQECGISFLSWFLFISDLPPLWCSFWKHVQELFLTEPSQKTVC